LAGACSALPWLFCNLPLSLSLLPCPSGMSSEEGQACLPRPRVVRDLLAEQEATASRGLCRSEALAEVLTAAVRACDEELESTISALRSSRERSRGRGGGFAARAAPCQDASASSRLSGPEASRVSSACHGVKAEGVEALASEAELLGQALEPRAKGGNHSSEASQSQSQLSPEATSTEVLSGVGTLHEVLLKLEATESSAAFREAKRLEQEWNTAVKAERESRRQRTRSRKEAQSPSSSLNQGSKGVLARDVFASSFGMTAAGIAQPAVTAALSALPNEAVLEAQSPISSPGQGSKGVLDRNAFSFSFGSVASGIAQPAVAASLPTSTEVVGEAVAAPVAEASSAALAEAFTLQRTKYAIDSRMEGMQGAGTAARTSQGETAAQIARDKDRNGSHTAVPRTSGAHGGA